MDRPPSLRYIHNYDDNNANASASGSSTANYNVTVTSTSLSKFEQIAPEILERIALYAVLLSSPPTIGPPAILTTLSLLSRKLHSIFSYHHTTTHLYAAVFRVKFDASVFHYGRRFSQRWDRTGCLAGELRRRFEVMRRLRMCSLSAGGGVEKGDWWTVYLMLLENDGLNRAQLIRWARIERVLPAALRAAVAPSPMDVELVSLITWIMWLTTSRQSLRREDPAIRKMIMDIVHPLIVAGYQYPHVYAPTTSFHLPLCHHTRPPSSSSSSSSPLYPYHPHLPLPPATRTTHYTHPLTLSLPLLSTSATLLYISRGETNLDERGPPDTSRMPSSREEADLVGVRATAGDVREAWGVRVGVPCVERGEEDDADGEDEEEEEEEESRKYDTDWSRLVSCYDPWNEEESPLRGPVYRPGTLSGTWSGRFIVCVFLSLFSFSYSFHPFTFIILAPAHAPALAVLSFSFSFLPILILEQRDPNMICVFVSWLYCSNRIFRGFGRWYIIRNTIRTFLFHLNHLNHLKIPLLNHLNLKIPFLNHLNLNHLNKTNTNHTPTKQPDSTYFSHRST
ncbi:hypothetical protein ONZ45_g2457 [Pleurotus djamor]|nr:hypothetical protein ONZ45_g2457 [Pleurotus djamor]